MQRHICTFVQTCTNWPNHNTNKLEYAWKNKAMEMSPGRMPLPSSPIGGFCPLWRTPSPIPTNPQYPFVSPKDGNPQFGNQGGRFSRGDKNPQIGTQAGGFSRWDNSAQFRNWARGCARGQVVCIKLPPLLDFVVHTNVPKIVPVQRGRGGFNPWGPTDLGYVLGAYTRVPKTVTHAGGGVHPRFTKHC